MKLAISVMISLSISVNTFAALSDANLSQLANKYKVSVASVKELESAIEKGGGTSAQFNIAELGGMGSWMKGGLIMLENSYDNVLKIRVSNLMDEISNSEGSCESCNGAKVADASINNLNGNVAGIMNQPMKPMQPMGPIANNGSGSSMSGSSGNKSYNYDSEKNSLIVTIGNRSAYLSTNGKIVSSVQVDANNTFIFKDSNGNVIVKW